MSALFIVFGKKLFTYGMTYFITGHIVFREESDKDQPRAHWGIDR